MTPPMPLSAAIRLGAMLRPQAFGVGFEDGASCAMAAAYESVGCDLDLAFDARSINKVMGWITLLESIASCPACDKNHGDSALGVVIHLNDFHQWSRERIATDFVEPIERHLAATQSAKELVGA